MFFGKRERSRISTCLALTVAALAVIGAASITKKGRSLIQNATCKVKSFVSSEL